MQWIPAHIRENVTTTAGLLVLSAVCVVLALVGLVTHPALPIAIVIGGWGLYLGVRYPFFTLLLFYVIFMSRLNEFFPVLGQLAVVRILLLATIITFFVAKLIARDWRFVPSQHNIWVALVVLAAVLSAAMGTDPEISFDYLTQSLAITFLIYYFSLNIINTPNQAAIFQVTLALTMVGLSLYGTWKSIEGVNLVEGSRAGLVGLLSDPNDFALVLLMAFPFLVTGALDLRGRIRIWFALGAIAVLNGVIVTQSRGGLIALIAALAVVFAPRIKNKIVLAGLASIALIGLLVFSGVGQRSSGGLGDMSGGLDESSQLRMSAWKAGLRMAARNPIFGVGYLQFPANFLDYQDDSPLWVQFTAHNSYIQVLAEAGLVGFIPWMVLIVLTLRVGRRLTIQSRAPTPTPDLVQILKKSTLATQIGFLVGAFFLSHGWHHYLYIIHMQAAVYANVFDLGNPPAKSNAMESP